jgi:Ran GTPase-activating protein (RanGAP) involved in mRNA processing and transport
LSYNEISDVGIEIFSKLIENCHTLESLNLQGNNLGPNSAEKISEALKNTEYLRYLNLENNQVGTNGVIVTVFIILGYH